MDTIRDMLSIGKQSHTLVTGHETRRWDEWVLWYWGDVQSTRKVISCAREDEVWGVAALIIEYVEKRGMSANTAIDAALTCYRNALDNAPAPGELAYQDHAHLMEATA